MDPVDRAGDSTTVEVGEVLAAVEAPGFDVAFRGYDPSQVHALLDRVAAALRAVADRPVPSGGLGTDAEVLDELLVRVADEVHRFREQARSEAAGATAEGRAAAAALVADAEQKAASLLAMARDAAAEVMAKAEAEAAAVRARVAAEAWAVARANASRGLSPGDAEAAATPSDAAEPHAVPPAPSHDTVW